MSRLDSQDCLQQVETKSKQVSCAAKVQGADCQILTPHMLRNTLLHAMMTPAAVVMHRPANSTHTHGWYSISCQQGPSRAGEPTSSEALTIAPLVHAAQRRDNSGVAAVTSIADKGNEALAGTLLGGLLVVAVGGPGEGNPGGGKHTAGTSATITGWSPVPFMAG